MEGKGRMMNGDVGREERGGEGEKMNKERSKKKGENEEGDGEGEGLTDRLRRCAANSLAAVFVARRDAVHPVCSLHSLR
jgi:sorbitol-specific phosphotransferase system component IIBC